MKRNLLSTMPHEPLPTAHEDAKLSRVSDEQEPHVANERASNASDAKDAKDASSEAKDVVMIHSPHDDGQGYNVLRVRDGSVEVGAIRNIRDGAPIHGDIVSLSRRKEHERLYNVETLVKNPRPPEPARHGPAQVATDKYRTNWDNIFGKTSPPQGNGPS